MTPDTAKRLVDLFVAYRSEIGWGDTCLYESYGTWRLEWRGKGRTYTVCLSDEELSLTKISGTDLGRMLGEQAKEAIKEAYHREGEK